MPQHAITIRRPRRRGFTLLEVLMASVLAAAACSAAMMLIQSVNSSASSSNGVYAAAADARNALGCVDMLLEQAAMIGYWDNGRILLWRNDDNGDGQINLLELTLISRNTGSDDLNVEQVRFAPGTLPAVVQLQNVAVPLAQFVSLSGVQAMEQNSNNTVRRLVGGLTQFSAWCDGTDGKAQAAQVTFTVGRNDGSQVFHAATALRSRTRATVP